MSSKRCAWAGLLLVPAVILACDVAGDEAGGAAGDAAGEGADVPDTAAEAAADTGASASSGAADTPASGPGTGDPDTAPPRPTSALHRYDTVFAYADAPHPGNGRTAPLVPLPRLVPDSADALSYALEALLAGPTDAEAPAVGATWFSERTAGMLRSVTLDDGFAVVDFRDLRRVIPNASTSAGSIMLLRHLQATVFQFPEVRRVEFRIDGECDTFMNWLQTGCVPLRRTEFGAPEGFRMAVPGRR